MIIHDNETLNKFPKGKNHFRRIKLLLESGLDIRELNDDRVMGRPISSQELFDFVMSGGVQ